MSTSSMMSVERAVYLAADALGIPLYRKPGVSTKARGAHPTTYTAGGMWTVVSDMVVESDVLAPEASAFFVRFIGDLWGYLVVSQGQGAMWLYLFDGGVVKARVGALDKVATGVVKNTVTYLHNAGAIRGQYNYTPKNGWSQVQS